MANVTKEIASFENGAVTFFIRYDDVTGFANRLMCENDLPQACYGSIVEPASGQVYGRTFQSGVTNQTIPSNLIKCRFTPDPEFPDVENFEIWHPVNLEWIIPQTAFRSPAAMQP